MKDVMSEQNVMDQTKNDDCLIRCRDWTSSNNALFVALDDKNGICEINNDGSVVLLGHYPSKHMGQHDLSWTSLILENHVYFSPFAADHIANLDIEKRAISYHQIDKPICEGLFGYDVNRKFFKVIGKDNKIFFCGWTYPAILELDLDTGKMNYITEWIGMIRNKKIGYSAYFSDGVALYNSYIVLPLAFTDGLLKYNTDYNSFEYQSLNSGYDGIWGGTVVAGDYYFSGVGNNINYICKLRIDTGVLNRIEAPESIFGNSTIRSFGRRLFVLCENAIIYMYEIDDNKWSVIRSRANDGEYLSTIKCSDKDDYIYSMNYTYGCLEKINYKSGTIDRMEYRINDDRFISQSHNEYVESVFEKSKEEPIKEGDISLRDFIKVLGS